MLTKNEGFILIIAYGVAMTLFVWLYSIKRKTSMDDFLVSNRNLGVFRGSFSIAVSWIWAPAIFIVSLQAYTKGIAGVFWFIVPNILCFFIYAPFAIRLRKLLPNGYSLPDYIRVRFKDYKHTHLMSLVIYFGYQIGAIIINAVAGATLINLLTGISFQVAVLAMVGIALSYSLISGLTASVITDVIQMALILFIGFIVVPWVIIKVGGVSVIQDGIGGVSGAYKNILDPKVAFAFGIAMSLGLISGPFADQMFFQRAFAAKRKKIGKIFIFGGIIFGVVPILLSLLGFIGAAPQVKAVINVTDPQMIGPIVVAKFLPKWALMLFTVMAFAGLSSTLDSAFSAVSSLGSIDIYRKYFNPKARPEMILKVARIFMLVTTIIGTLIALMNPKLLWVFLIYGALASSALFPTILSVYWSRLTGKGAFWAFLLSVLIGTPLSIYANVSENTNLIVIAAILSVLIGLIVCLIFGFNNKVRFNFKDLLDNN